VLIFELVVVVLALLASLALRPWRMLAGPLGPPWAASLVVLSLLWVLPQMLPSGISIQLSGACLLVLMFGWPLAVIELVLIALLVRLFGGLGWADVMSQLVWIGLVPATSRPGAGRGTAQDAAAAPLHLHPRPWLHRHGGLHLPRGRRV